MLIGIDEYTDSEIPDLHGCVNDVKAMASLLTDCYGLREAVVADELAFLRLGPVQALEFRLSGRSP